jgi:protein-S-isoprenylcysteine O-methyltransferase Ste14
VGIAGVIGAGCAIVVLREWPQPSWLKTLVVLGASAAGMILVRLTLNKASSSLSTGIAREPLRPLNPQRIALKLAGLWATVAALALAYAVLSEYASHLYAPFKSAALWCLPGLAAVAPFYVAYVDRRQWEPEDAYAQIGRLLAGRTPGDWDAVRLHALGWGVKGFFLPLMFAYSHDGLVSLWGRTALLSPPGFPGLFSLLIDMFFLFDVLLAVVAYTCTLRLLDSHIRSVEPSVAGWAICLVCYQPFVNGSLNAYFGYNADGLYWGDVFAPYPAVYLAWGSTILVLVAIYLLSTAAFGLLFSNLTNRGIVSSGPYRWLKHPAYVSKNVSWWLISVPFIAGAGWFTALQSCLMLLCVNLVYFLRAKTEERHLRADPVYREYEAFIAEHGLLAILARLMRGTARRLRTAA